MQTFYLYWTVVERQKGFLNEMCMDSQSTAYLEKIIIVSINHHHVAADEFLDIAIVYYEFARSVRRFTKS